VADRVELSVVMPCLNEADTLGTCISRARQALEAEGIEGEVIVADNGSTDGSQEIAARMGAMVVPVNQRGYGNALLGGIRAARGTFVIMADADASYDFMEIPRFLRKLREGYALVQGCRLPSGGGTVEPGAMPMLHRWFGNPVLSLLAQVMFGSSAHDIYCGMRGFRKDLIAQLGLRCAGMEFATEMIIKAVLAGAPMAEVPISLHRDGRKVHAPHLNTFRDGWRTLRLFLMYSPGWLFGLPGGILVLAGVVGYLLALPGRTVAGATLDAHTLLVASLCLLVGHQTLLFSLMAKVQAIQEGFSREAPIIARVLNAYTLERGLLVAAVCVLMGATLVGAALYDWWLVDFGRLEYGHTMRLVVPGVTSIALGFQVFFGSFLRTILTRTDTL